MGEANCFHKRIFQRVEEYRGLKFILNGVNIWLDNLGENEQNFKWCGDEFVMSIWTGYQENEQKQKQRWKSAIL